nr:hypothetical protein [Sphingomonas sp.]
MMRWLHMCLLVMAVLGLLGQSMAVAMVPAPMSAASMQASMAGMNCMDTANAPVPGKAPCKKMTSQCMVAMGCAPVALVEPAGSSILSIADPMKPAQQLPAPLRGRSYGPEPDPPAILI